MLRNELHRLGRLAGLRRQQNRIGTLAFAATRVVHTAHVSATIHFPIDFAIRMMQIGQLHHLHFRLLVDGTVGGGISIMKIIINKMHY